MTSGTELVVYTHGDTTATRVMYPTYPTGYYFERQEKVEEFEFAEKKRKPHHIRKKKGWER